LNDFLSLGTMLGAPVLISFLSVVWMAFGIPGGSDLTTLVTGAACRAGLLTVLTGFWFDDGLFYLAPGIPFWALLALCWGMSLRQRNTGGSEEFCTSTRIGHASAGERKSSRWVRHCTAVLFAAVIGLVYGVIWVSVRDPIKRIAFEVSGPDGHRTNGMAIVPRTEGVKPVAVYLHGSGGTVLKDGPTLRLFAELGFAAVSIDYEKSNQAVFNGQLSGLGTWLKRQPWADSESVVWIGSSLGAQRSLSYLLRESAMNPDLYVRVGGGLVREARAPDARRARIECPTLLLHGENDQVFPLEECEQLAEILRNGGTPTGAVILAEQDHGFRPDRLGVMRALGEFCAEQMDDDGRFSRNSTPVSPVAGLPVAFFLACIGLVFWRGGLWLLRGDSETSSRLEQTFRVGVKLAVLSSVICSGVCLALPAMPVNKARIERAVEWGIVNVGKWDAEFLGGLDLSHLIAQPTTGDLLEHAELTNYRGRFLYGDLDDDFWRRYVMSPLIAGDSTRIDWRRPLWESFYPRVRKEDSPMDAAIIVCRFLRERVSIVSDFQETQGVHASWFSRRANSADWERLYVAALRSGGIAARLNRTGDAEIWDGDEWLSAPRPLVSRFEVSFH